MVRTPRAWAALALLAGAAACSVGGPPSGPISIAAVTASPPAAGHLVEVTGLSGDELRALQRSTPDAAAWQDLLRINVAGNDVTAVAGRYEVTDSALRFLPQFPFDADRDYVVRFDPSRLPTPRPDPVVNSTIRVAGPGRATPASVVAIYPSGDIWPENMLRFYIHFSAPMSRTGGVRFIHLVDDRGREETDAILAAYADLWNDDQTRLTVFFDPGRVKRGVGPNLDLGRAIVEGRRYAIVVDAGWPDAAGQPLAAPFRREFTAGPAAYDGLSLSDWRLTPPAADSTRPLAVVFPAPLDHALLGRTIGVKTIDGRDVPGRSDTSAHETTWTFTPDEPWVAGGYELAVLTLLEDPAGNRVGQPFEILPDQPMPPSTGDIATVRFDVR